MENRGKRQASSIFGGMGFYIALLVCVVAAGVVGYFALLRNDPTPDPISTVEVDPGPAQSVAAPDPEPAEPVVGAAPIITEHPTVRPIVEPEEEEIPAPAPVPEPAEAMGDDDPFFNEDDAPVMEPAPIEAVEPMVVVAPLEGDAVAVFSVDQLTYDATLGDWRTHDGVDIQAAAGTEVVSAAAGIVLSVEEDSRMGTTVIVDHLNGYMTTYASLQEAAVLVGDEIPAGAPVGKAGNTSLTEAGLGAHLHFSVSRDGALVDPSEFLAE